MVLTFRAFFMFSLNEKRHPELVSGSKSFESKDIRS